MNNRGQVTGISLGNGLSTELGYDEFGFPKSIFTGGGTVQDLEFTFDPQTGNLMQRKNNKGTSQGGDLIEDFTYDDLMKNRLESWHVVGQQTQTYSISYIDPSGTDVDNNGNIYTKSDVTQGSGKFNYGEGAGPHAITSITVPTSQFLEKAQETQDIGYTAFEKVKYIEQDVIINDVTGETNTYRMDFVYGPDHARKKTILTNVTTGETIKTKIYAGNCEYEEDALGNIKVLTYVANVGIYVEENNQGSMYYVHTDYLGNYQAITDETGNLVEELSFDPWGRRRNADDWSFNNVPETFMFDRGYTGHEHLDVFAIINMNGRVYDPWLGRFLSPDNFVQDPGFSQNFNRYAYGLNNPLIYTDPSGEVALIDDAILGLIGGTINLISNAGNIHSLGQGLGYFGIGFVSGALAEYITPVGAAALMGAGNAALGSYTNTGHVDPGAVIQGAVTSGIVSGLTMGLGQAIAPSLSNAFSGIASPVLKGAITQGVIGTGLGAVGGGLGSVMNGGNFWEGAGQGALWGGGIGFASGAYGGFQYAKARDLNPWTGRSTLPPLTPLESIPCNGVRPYNSSYNDPSELRVPNKLYHYTYDDPYGWNELGREGKTLYLTPNGELNRLSATYDLDLPRVPRYQIEINTSDPNFNLSNIQISRSVNGNFYGHGGGGWEILYNGTYQPSGTYGLIIRKIW